MDGRIVNQKLYKSRITSNDDCYPQSKALPPFKEAGSFFPNALSNKEFSKSEQVALTSSRGQPSFSGEDLSFYPEHKSLKGVRKLFFGFDYDIKNDFSNIDLQILVRLYKEWLKEPLYIVYEFQENRDTLFRRAAKRGNDIYAYRIKQILEEKTAFMNEEKFKKMLLRGDRNNTVTNVMFVTLTWDTNIFLGNKKRAWRNISYFYNRFMAAFRKRYGKTWALRCLESTEKGYPHLHIVLVCEKEFRVFRHREKIRLEKKREIESLWGSWVDVEVPKNVYGLKSYLFKDLLKQYFDRGSDRGYMSLALSWVFKKQSYAISTWKGKNDLFMQRVIQTEEAEFKTKYQNRKLIFRGLVVMRIISSKKPPSEVIVKLTEMKRQELYGSGDIENYRGCLFKIK